MTPAGAPVKKELIIRKPRRGHAEMLWRFTFGNGSVHLVGPWANLPDEDSIAPAIAELRTYQTPFSVVDERREP